MWLRRVVICLGVCVLLTTVPAAYPVEPRPGLRLPREAWSSLAWSPDGKTIAFIVTTRSLSPTESDGRLKGARIYLLDVDSGKRRLLCRMHDWLQIPKGLFWLSSNRIGWAALRDYRTVCFMSSSTRAFKAEQLADVRIALMQWWNTDGPPDVYYDAGSDRLVFTGFVRCDVPIESVSRCVVCSYDLRSRALRVLPCPVAVSDTPATACVRRTRTGRTVYDIAYHADQSVLWETSADGSGRAIGVSVRSQEFPRPSPNGRLLALIQRRVRAMGGSDGGDDLHDDLVLYDTVSKSGKILVVMLSPRGRGLQPTLGVPFCWSPKGDRIAYADGESIKFVKVPSALPAGHSKPVRGRSKR